MCVSSCPYKKVYVNHKAGKAEKCTFCFPRIEAGQPTVYLWRPYVVYRRRTPLDVR